MATFDDFSHGLRDGRDGRDGTVPENVQDSGNVYSSEDKMLCAIRVSIHSDFAEFRYAEIYSHLKQHCVHDFSMIPNSNRQSVSQRDPEGNVLDGVLDVARHPLDVPGLIFVLVSRHDEPTLARLVTETVLTKLVLEVFAAAGDAELLEREVRCAVDVKAFRKLIDEKGSFAWVIDTCGKRIDGKERVARMNDLSFLFTKEERANLKSPGVQFAIVDVFKNDTNLAAKAEALRSVFGRVIAKRQKNGWPRRYALPDRPILGPTSLDHELAFIMKAMAGVRGGDLVVDPFCGTGSLLVAAADAGAICFGSDLDGRVLRGRGVSRVNKIYPPEKLPRAARWTFETGGPSDQTERFAWPFRDCSVMTNFRYYGLPLPEIFRMDAGCPSLRGNFADAVITDIPYGIRAMAREHQADKAAGGLTSTIPTSVTFLLESLLTVSRDILVPKGRLVCVLPVPHGTREEALADFLSLAETYELRSYLTPCYQELAADVGRYVVSLRKG